MPKIVISGWMQSVWFCLVIVFLLVGHLSEPNNLPRNVSIVYACVVLAWVVGYFRKPGQSRSQDSN
jgi:hypothetical protein